MSKTARFKHNGTPYREPLHYTACGLDNIYLTGGYEVKEIGGETFVSVHDVEDLHMAIATYLAKQRKVLAGPEVRFLRKYLDLTQRELGELLGVSDQSVARYEKAQSTLEGASDALLRLLVTAQAQGCINVRDELSAIRSADDAADDEMTFERSDHEWRVAA